MKDRDFAFEKVKKIITAAYQTISQAGPFNPDYAYDRKHMAG